MAGNVNRWVGTGNLTRDPELRTLPNGTTLCELRLACNGRRKNSEGQWEDDPNYFNVNVWGPQGENCKRYLSKGSAVAIDGRLRWREWETEGQKRQAVDIVAETVQFLGGGNGGNGGGGQQGYSAPQSDVPVDTADFVPQSAQPSFGGGGSGYGPGGIPDDDIPF